MTYVLLYFVVGKESNDIFSTDIRILLYLARKVIHVGFEPRDDSEKVIQVFSDCTYPIDIFAE